MNNFINAMKKANNYTTTENGEVAVKSTNDAIVDLFGMIGSLRTRSEADVINLFMKAYAEDKELAIKMLFYARDIRGGLGERKTFRIISRYLATRDTSNMRLNLHLIPEYGRWDDLYVFVGTPLEDDMFKLFGKQLIDDIETATAALNNKTFKPISLAGKWAKSLSASSKESKRLARLTAEKIGLYNTDGKTIYEKYFLYQKALSFLRKYLSVTERLMSTKNFDQINFETVPSLAMKKYREAFKRNVPELYQSYLDSVQKGEAKINASTLYPYDLVRPYITHFSKYEGASVDQTLEAQWKALPNYVEGENNFLIMADMSSSMTWYNNAQAEATAVGLAIYFAERNKGFFHNVAMSFADEPEFMIFMDEQNLCEKVNQMFSYKVGYSTNIWAAMQMIHDVAVNNKLKPEELPTSLIIISDMQFNPSYTGDSDNTLFYDKVKNLFEKDGYKVPNIVFWNVEGRENTFHIDRNAQGVQLASGSHPSVFKALIENVGLTPYDMVVNVLNSERYKAIRVL